MDMISECSDDLIFRILSLVPTTDVLAMCSVSTRWRSLWNLVSGLEFDDRNHENDYKRFTQFVYNTLLLNKAPVLEKLHLNLGPKCHAVDVGIWIDTAVSHHLRDLVVDIRPGSGSVNLPSSLFTCQTLETLALVRCLVSDVPCCLPSLGMLSLKDVIYASLPKLLSGCPNLELLKVMVEEEDQRVEDITVEVPCLRLLELWDARNGSKGGVQVIEAPRLEYLKIVDDAVYDSRRIQNMPSLMAAHVDITQGVTHRFLRSLASTRRLYLCVSLLSEVPSMIIHFHRLVHLELNTCAQGWWELLTQMLQSSPKLASLKLTDKHELEIPSEETPDCWKRPSSVPKSLETFAWSGYKGRRGDIEVATFVIKNATRLKTATFSPECIGLEAKDRMLKDLVSVSRLSSVSCQLLFD
ncbi:PREDICTED: F-box/FBD/LRR-repeat protein At4g26340-like isoform X1 [Camelina sativa]|uniref:F-box/FBD/LRR-repeat protein At4g26340-like isoform X1 n=1 Tax=Camelina sativa TaxID=90675 RepID=A0ABM1R6Y6_CAMSA|nr:PREDICTED: F-box/FBD/LRR-repeat protein At4g26340-like isoform X1 [Camelina sativa]